MIRFATVLGAALAKKGYRLDHLEEADSDLWGDSEHLLVYVKGEPRPFVSPSLGATYNDLEWGETIALRLGARLNSRHAAEIGAIEKVKRGQPA